MNESIQPVGARPQTSLTQIPEEYSTVLKAIQDIRSDLMKETYNSNDPSWLNTLRKRSSQIGTALKNYIRRQDRKELEEMEETQDLIPVLEPFVKKYNFSQVCTLCSVIDALFEQAPFTKDPSHALLLQKNIPSEQNV